MKKVTFSVRHDLEYGGFQDSEASSDLGEGPQEINRPPNRGNSNGCRLSPFDSWL
jgi:hypothetical protein